MALSIGVDVGNNGTKSQHTVTISGYKLQSMKPSIANEWLFYDGDYYVPTTEPFSYTMDKTENGHALILSLFAIAKEILYTVEHMYEYGKVNTQELVNRYHDINLGIGLPPGHFDSLAKKTKEYYENIFNKGVEFVYKDISFRIRLKELKIYPQDFMAVWKNPASEIAAEYDKYYIIGIGGYTVDIISVNDKQVEADKCRSLGMGISVMYENIVKEVLKAGVSISPDGIERALRGRKHILPENVVEIIKKNASLHADEIIDACKTANVRFAEAPVIFFGGGCLLLREYLEANKDICKCEFIEDIHANAVYYAEYFKE